MNKTTVGLAIALSIGLAISRPAGAAALAQTGGGFCPGGVCAGGEEGTEGGGGRSQGLPLEWDRIWDQELTCPADVVPTPTPDAARYRDRLIDLRTLQVIAEEPWRCWDPAVSPGEPPFPPLPPGPEEVFDRAPIPIPEVNISPDGRGLVGLDSWLWYDQATEATAAVDLAGWHPEVSARIVEWEYDMGEGETVSGDRQPTEADPYTYLYRRHCSCRVTVRTWWSGTYTATHPLLVQPIVIPLGRQSFESSRGYDVIEIEAADLDGDDD